jgi:hypothetical protein
MIATDLLSFFVGICLATGTTQLALTYHCFCFYSCSCQVIAKAAITVTADNFNPLKEDARPPGTPHALLIIRS